MFRTSLIFFAFSCVSYECAVIADGTDNTGNGGILRNWMSNMRDRMSNREPGRMMSNLMGNFDLSNLGKMKIPPMVISMMTGERMFQPVNLTNVKFDPKSDRAYRMGNLYMIRRRSSTNNKDDSAEDWSEFFDRKDDMMNNGQQGIDDMKCILWEPIKSTIRNNESGEDLIAEAL